jgi:hypothetical protein
MIAGDLFPPNNPSETLAEQNMRLKAQAAELCLASEQLRADSVAVRAHLYPLLDGRSVPLREASRRARQCSKYLRWAIGLPLFGTTEPAPTNESP